MTPDLPLVEPPVVGLDRRIVWLIVLLPLLLLLLLLRDVKFKLDIGRLFSSPEANDDGYILLFEFLLPLNTLPLEELLLIEPLF